MKSYWGIDLGGTKIEGGVLDSPTSREPLCRIRIATEAEQGYEHILARVSFLIEQMKQASSLEASSVGVAHPGSIDPSSELLKNSNTGCLNGKKLRKDLEEKLSTPVVAANDANCFTLAESKLGASRGANVSFGVILGTGVGGGITVSGRLLPGVQGIAGEWGHNVLDSSGAPCYCGKNGCVETVISGPALERYYFECTNERKSLEAIYQQSKQGHLASVKTIDRLLENFGKAISTVLNVLDPEVVVLGGGVSNIEDLYTKAEDAIKPHIFHSRVQTKILRNSLGDSAGVFGAALLTS